jgi:hypothetical protein
MVSGKRIGLIVLLCGVLFVTLVMRSGMQGVSVAQTRPCLHWTDGLFTFALAGYRANEDGSYTLTWQVTNHGRQDISYVAFGTATWTRMGPESGSIHSGALGAYHIEWTKDRGNPGFASVKYETEFAGFGQGASDTFTLVVGDFDPITPFRVQAKAGRTVGSVIFTLAEEPTCDRTPPTPTPTTPFSPLPTPTATPEGYALPADPIVPPCLFEPPPGGVPAEPITPLTAYSFSEPQLVLTTTTHIDIQQWLPDSAMLLISRESGISQTVSVELVNTTTGNIIEIVEARRYLRKPRWLAEDSTVIWRELGDMLDSVPGYWEPGYQLRSFEPLSERRLSSSGNGASITHDVSPDGKKFVFLSLPGGTQPLIWNQETKTLHALPVDLATWRYQNGPIYPFQPFNVNWHPGGEQILFWDGTWVFLYDLRTDTGCEIDIDALIPPHSPFTFIQEASWSPNGRYLLLKNAEYPPYTMTHGPHDLVLILDTYTGEAVQYALGSLVVNLSWAPDSQTVVMTKKTGEDMDSYGRFNLYGLFLFNVRSGETGQILPEQEGGGPKKFFWSPDGTRLAFLGMLPHGDESGNNVGGVLVSQVTQSR